jgi:hypothetical protein
MLTVKVTSPPTGGATIQDTERFFRVFRNGMRKATNAGLRRTSGSVRTELKARIRKGWDGGQPLAASTKLLYQHGMPAVSLTWDRWTKSERSGGRMQTGKAVRVAPGGRAIPAYAGHKQGWYRSGALHRNVVRYRMPGGGYVVTVDGVGPQGQLLHRVAAGLEQGWSKRIYFSRGARMYLASLFRKSGGYQRNTEKSPRKLVTVRPRPVFRATYLAAQPYALGWFMSAFGASYQKRWSAAMTSSKARRYVYQIATKMKGMGNGKLGGPDWQDRLP